MIRIRKFAIDYLAATALAVVSLIIVLGNVTLLDTSAEITLFQACEKPFSGALVINRAQDVLREGEACEIASPCDKWQKVRCHGTQTFLDIFMETLFFNDLTFRVKDSVYPAGWLLGYKNRANLRISADRLLLVFIYSLFLIEAGALIFALWRQKALSNLFQLPGESYKDHVLKPLFWSVLFAAFIFVVNGWVYDAFRHPPNNTSFLGEAVMSSLWGIAFGALIAPFLEELLFRGIFLRHFIERDHMVAGIILVSVIFALLHAFNEVAPGWQLYRFALYFAGSVMLCLVYIKNRSLWSAVAFHSGYNTTLMLLYAGFS